MSKSNLRIFKQCICCGGMFEAQKVTTKYCSHRCNSKHYKLKKRIAQKIEFEPQVLDAPTISRPKVTALDSAVLMSKEFLTIKEVAFLFSCNEKTVHRFIATGRLKAIKLSDRKYLVRRKFIEEL